MQVTDTLVTDARQITLRPGESQRMWLGVGASSFGPVRVPLFVARGPRPGPKLVAVACQHADEVYGLLGALDLMNEMRADDLRGELWILPCLNVLAYINKHRISPYDHQDMNRVFPGRTDGTVTEQTARQVLDQVLPGADLLVDLHGGSIDNGDIAFGRWTDAPGKPSAFPVVSCMDLDFLVVPPDTSPGSLGATTLEAGVPHISIESGSCVRYARDNAMEMAEFVKVAMAYLEMVDGPRPQPKALPFMRTVSRRSRTGGAFKTLVSMGERVSKGTNMGVVMDLLGNVLQTVEAAEDGIVTVMRTGVHVHPGESLITIAVPTAPPA